MLAQLPFDWQSKIKAVVSDFLEYKFHSFFSFLTLECKKDLLVHARPIAFMKDDKVIERAKEARGLFLIIRGEVLSYKRNPKYGVSFYMAGQDFGDESITGSRSYLTYQCVTDTVCIFIQSADLVQVLEDHQQDYLWLKRRTKMRLSYQRTL